MTSATILLDGPRALVSLIVVVLVPLALHATALPRLARASLPAGVLAAVSLWAVDAGSPSAIGLVAPYAVVCALAGLVGLRRLLARWTEAAQLAMAVGLVALAGAATWLVCHRAGVALLGYPPFWVILTAAHFHVAGAFLAIVVGWCAEGRGVLARAVAIGCVLGVPLTAAGIYGPAWLEVTGALVMASSGVGAAIVVGDARSPRPAVAVLRLSALPLGAGMILATMYALRAHGTALVLDGLDPLSSMIVTHGVLDTTFALLALGAIARIGPRVREAPPLSRLRGRWPVGATFFQRLQLERAAHGDGGETPRGLVDQLDELCSTETVAPTIRRFYEDTGAHELVVRPRWRPGFRTGARAWAVLARRMGQLQLPVVAESGREGIASRIVPLDEAADGRRWPRAWIRTYPDGRALYVAAYSTHQDAAHPYMNIAFPLPGGQLSSVLRMVARGAGVTVSTRLGGDCGIWLVLWGVAVRLPLSETIDVWTRDDPSAPAELRAWADGYTTIARHDLWLFGLHYLTLDYAMRPRA